MAIRRAAWWALALGVISLLVYLMATASTGPTDPTEVGGHQAHATVVANAAIIVFREGLEAVLIFAAVAASMLGAQRRFRRPMAAGVAVAFAATVGTWFLAQAILEQFSRYGDRLQAVTGLIAIGVLLLVMNWFFHKVYWAGWISMHSRRKQSLLKAASPARLMWGLAVLGFSSLYREGFEVVLFLQSYRLKLGGTPLLYGVSLGLALTVSVGVLTFVAHRRLPYRRMLVFTGIMLGLVLLVMVGEQAQEMQLANWLPTTPIASLSHLIPDWMGLWFAVFPTAETLAAQALAGALVIGSYFLAREQTGSHVAVNG
jgi:high-affinity iron transporter